ncbi:MAG: hypothetical protein Q7S21_01980 [archaeon]|nr:hypothetical protein [archaeon]
MEKQQIVIVLLALVIALVGLNLFFNFAGITPAGQARLPVTIPPEGGGGAGGGDPDPTITYNGNQARVSCTFNPGSSDWKACTCPDTYYATGQFGYNCQAVTAWGCTSTTGYDNLVYFYHDGQGQAYVGVYCIKP